MISIVMSYLDRRPQLIRTLNSIYESEYTNFEIICVDDGSREEHKIKDLEQEFKNLKIIEIDPAQKDWTDTAIPWNIGFSHINPNANFVIIQNAECMHVSDIMMHVVDNITDDLYIAYATYALTLESTAKLDKDGAQSFFPLYQRIMRHGEDGWYNHTIHRPVSYCFCAAITHATLKRLGGFDERFSYGCGKGDRDILDRLKRMHVNITISDEKHVVFHQFHEQNPYGWDRPESEPLKTKNSALYARTQQETCYRAPANKYYTGE